MAKRNKTIKLIVIIILLIVLLSTAVFSGIKIVEWFINNNENKEIQNKISNYIKKDKDKKEYNVDFKSLKEINPDTIAWLKVNNTDIENVVVKTDNNEYYLKHNFEKKQNVAGWIFADYRNKFDDKDYNIVIYGHNMRNDSMFGTLKNTLKEEWYKNKENKYVTLVTNSGIKKYEVFSVYEEKVNNYYIQTEFENDSKYSEFLKTLKNKSIYNFNTDINNTKGILTLSTCGNDNAYRIVLHAKII